MDLLPGTTKRQFEETVDRIGLWVIYARADRRFRCRACGSLSHKDGRADCGACFGSGYQARLERWLVGYASSTRRVQADDGKLTPVGIESDRSPVVFTRAADVPRVGDRIFLVEWDVPRERQRHYGRQVQLVQPLLVTDTDPQILAGVTFWVTTCELQNELRQQYERALLGAVVPPRTR